MKFPRSSGVLLHPTSLPGPFGIGDLGPEAYRFVDFLADAGQRIWQVLPLGPTGHSDSPYQSFSAFAGNPLLISPEKLVEHGYLKSVEAPDDFPEKRVDFGRVIPFKYDLLRKAFGNFRESTEYQDFRERNSYWLDDYVRFMAGKHDGAEAHRFWQYEFFRQWDELKRYCEQRRIRVMGDLPIYVAGDSSDVWAHPEMFNQAMVSGVPPDYFSTTGQLWGNPVYRWDHIAATGFSWWIERFRAVFNQVDMVRLDHFRGFEAYWQVPATAKTAVDGEWIKGPGAALFEAVRKELGDLPIVAENLGVITPEVEALRNRFGFPGMSVLQFAFGNGPQAHTFRPHNYPREVVAYSGTHDNDTTIGWWNSRAATDSTRAADEIERERAVTKAYLGVEGGEINWSFIRALQASVADTVLIPLQDVLGLGSEGRMNLPASTQGNWTWRFRAGDITPKMRERLKQYAVLYER